tara:strand:- start:295 stop:702 length:408 start_codon:yes stop_codon:yes gene_type:complete
MKLKQLVFNFPILILVFTFFLAGCSTKQFRAVSKECKREAYSMYSPNYIERKEEAVRYETIPDGNINCRTRKIQKWEPEFGSHKTTCTQGTRQIAIPYTKTVRIDLNEEARNQKWRRCIRQTCRNRYGNSKCKTN